MASYQQQRPSASSRVPMASNASMVSTTADSESQGRFSRVRDAPNAQQAIAAPRYSKGIVMDVIPDKQVPSAALARHFPNAARRMREFRDAPKPAKAKSNVFGNLKDSIFGAKEGAVVKGERNEDGSRLRITPEDALMWRRLHLRAVEKERQAGGSRRGAEHVKARKDALHARNKLWSKRVDAMRGFQDREQKEVKAHVKARGEESSLRHKAFIEERVRRLAFRDKVRAMKVEKIRAGRKLEQKFLKKHGGEKPE